MIYVHVPFCRRFCTYCDFYSEIPCDGNAAFRKYTDDICAEIVSRRDEIEKTSAVSTLYIGGGTPSVLPLSCLERIVKALGGGPWKEFTVEVNPDDITDGYASGLRALGVNRISMGVQSLNDGILRWMNRRHDAAGAERAFKTLRKAGFDNISVDIIFGISILPDAILTETLERVLAWRPEHVSAYQLSIEEGSALGAMVADGRYSEASDEMCRDQYGRLCARLAEAGYEHYEISNWSLPGCRAVHNSAYWTRAPYTGLGPGAHSLSISDDGSTQTRRWNSESVTGWTSDCEVLTEKEIREEEMMLGLRTAEGWNGRRLSESEWFISDTIISDLF